MLTSKQRAKLRAMANGLDTIFQIGKGGVSSEMLKGISDALEARELIKVRILDNCDYTVREAADEVSKSLAADVVCVVGTKFVLYRRSSIEKNRKIEI